MYNIKRSLAELCNGSTTDSDSVCWGSNPYSAAKNKDHEFFVVFIFFNGIRTRREQAKPAEETSPADCFADVGNERSEAKATGSPTHAERQQES